MAASLSLLAEAAMAGWLIASTEQRARLRLSSKGKEEPREEEPLTL
jgi:hypothetical protein